MSLGDDLEAAERRAREDVFRASANCETADSVALDRYGAVCRLAGRAQAYMTPDEKNDAAAELARLMEGLG